MSPAGTVAATSFSDLPGINENKQTGIERVKAVVQSIAELRRYLLIEQPAMLKDAAPCLVAAESEILNLWGKMS